MSALLSPMLDGSVSSVENARTAAICQRRSSAYLAHSSLHFRRERALLSVTDAAKGRAMMTLTVAVMPGSLQRDLRPYSVI